jgi:hypothetical protein
MVIPVIVGLVLYEGSIQIKETMDRRNGYKIAQEMRDEHGVPLVVIGCPKFGRVFPNFHHGHGDYTLDISHHSTCTCPNPVTADVREIDQIFGERSIIVFSSHVLEHLTPEMGYEALEAIGRAAVDWVHVWPTKMSIAAWIAPTHMSWPHMTEEGIMFEDRNREGRLV